MIEIVKAEEKYFEYLCTTQNNTLLYHSKFDSEYAIIKDIQSTKNFISTQNLSFVALCDNNPVGAVVGESVLEPSGRTSPFAHLRNIWVDKDYRHKGIAQMLIETFESEAKIKGCKYVDLHVDVQNDSALNFWNKQNYNTYQERKRRLI